MLGLHSKPCFCSDSCNHCFEPVFIKRKVMGKISNAVYSKLTLAYFFLKVLKKITLRLLTVLWCPICWPGNFAWYVTAMTIRSKPWESSPFDTCQKDNKKNIKCVKGSKVYCEQLPAQTCKTYSFYSFLAVYLLPSCWDCSVRKPIASSKWTPVYDPMPSRVNYLK